jgi:hypothetical protein
MPHWVAYYLTERGKKEAEKAVRALDRQLREHLEAVTREVSQLGFHELLRRVYDEAPEFTVNSVLKGVLRQ